MFCCHDSRLYKCTSLSALCVYSLSLQSDGSPTCMLSLGLITISVCLLNKKSPARAGNLSPQPAARSPPRKLQFGPRPSYIFKQSCLIPRHRILSYEVNFFYNSSLILPYLNDFNKGRSELGLVSTMTITIMAR